MTTNPTNQPGFAPHVTAAAGRQVVVVANAGQLEPLRGGAAMARLAQPVLLPLSATEAVPDERLAEADLLVLEVDPADAASLARIGKVREGHPLLPIIAALHDADAKAVGALVRQGLADVARLPFDAAELAVQVGAVLGELTLAANGQRLAPLVVVAGSNGGCGATTVITHLAATLCARPEFRRVCLVDLDLQAGEAAHYLGQEPRVTVTALLEAGDRLDPELLRGAITDSGHGFAILASPTTVTPLDNVDDTRLLALLQLVRHEFDMVLVDLPTDWTSWSLSVVAAASRVLLLTNPSVAGLRQAKRRLELFDTVGIDRAHVSVVVNRAEQKLFHPISTADVAEVLERPVFAALGDEGDALTMAQNEGRLLTDIRRHTRFGKQVEALAALLISQQGNKP
jgi:pilus assembly protein CpaE